MKKIVIALDSFKGCLTSAEAGEAAAQGVHAACPECRTIVLPVADGGEGMLDVLLAASNGKRITVRAHDPLMQPCDASYGISGDGNTAFVEMAAISGLPLVPADKRNPMKTTTFGTGELIRDALERGCLRFVIGLGGSATNDAGLGMLHSNIQFLYHICVCSFLGSEYVGCSIGTRSGKHGKRHRPMRCPSIGNQLH